MLVDPKTGAVKLTASELNELRQAAARNGHVVNRVSNTTEFLEAAVEGLTPSLVQDLLDYLETGQSRFTGCSSVEELRERLSGDG